MQNQKGGRLPFPGGGETRIEQGSEWFFRTAALLNDECTDPCSLTAVENGSLSSVPNHSIH